MTASRFCAICFGEMPAATSGQRCAKCRDVEQRFQAAYPGEQPSSMTLQFFARNGRRPGDPAPRKVAPAPPPVELQGEPARDHAPAIMTCRIHGDQPRIASRPFDCPICTTDAPAKDGADTEGAGAQEGRAGSAGANPGSIPGTVRGSPPPLAEPIDEPMPAVVDCSVHGTSIARPDGSCPVCQDSGLDLSSREAASSQHAPERLAARPVEKTQQEDRTMNTPAAAPAAASPTVPPAPKPAAPKDDLATPRMPATMGPARIGIVPARKSRDPLKVALIAVSHGGKTYSALQMARGIVEGLGHSANRRGAGFDWWRYDVEPDGPARVLVADTERSASDYAHLYAYDVCPLSQPYTAARYREAYEQAIAGGYDVLIIDSATHLWAGEGGILSQVDASTGDKRQAWAKANPGWEAFKTGIILQTKIHLIVCFRAKSEYEVVNGKRVKVGIDAISREGTEYEFNVAFNLAHENHLATLEKDRTELFKDRPGFLITSDTGRELIAWRVSNSDERPVASMSAVKAPVKAQGNAAASTPKAPTQVQRDEVRRLRLELGLELDEVKDRAGIARTVAITTAEQAEALLAVLREGIEERKNVAAAEPETGL